MNSHFGFVFVLGTTHEWFDPGGAFLLSFTQVASRDPRTVVGCQDETGSGKMMFE